MKLCPILCDPMDYYSTSAPSPLPPHPPLPIVLAVKLRSDLFSRCCHLEQRNQTPITLWIML